MSDGDDIPHLSEDGESVESDIVAEEVAQSGDEGDDLYNENFLQDYAPIPELDQYEYDDMVVEDVTERLPAEEEVAARKRAEEEMDARDRQLDYRKSDLDSMDIDVRPNRRRRLEALQAGDFHEADDEFGDNLLVEFQDAKWPLKEWLQQERVKHEVDALFRRFVHNYREVPTEGALYEAKIRDLITHSKTSLIVDFMHMAKYSQVLYQWTVLQPKQMIEIFDKAAYEMVCERQSNFSLLWSKEVYVRFENIPVEEKLRSLTKDALETLIYLKGVVTRRTGVFPQLKQVQYDCGRCGGTVGPFFINDESDFKPERCPNCQSKGPMSVNSQNTIYGNYQKITLQESPGDVPPGMVPRQKEVILQQDLIDFARPGDEVMVCGLYTHTFDPYLNKKCGFPVFRTTIEANNIIRRDLASSVLQLTDSEKEEIMKLSKDPRIAVRIFKSIAPSIHGHEYIKKAIAAALFGGNEKQAGLTQMRGDINVLLLGDPGTGKSQFLKYVQKAAQRSVYSNGKGASAVGLTAAVHKDPVTREWTLEGGALVLADRGVCLIDEFDKMNDQDRVSIHEAMEQQSISISKAGIITQLQARCAVIAAANPIGGKYDIRLPFSQNVLLEDPIISRFDCLCVVRDVVEAEADAKLSKFILGVHYASHPDERKKADECESAFRRGKVEEGKMDLDDEKERMMTAEDPDIIPQDLLRKYITYAKTCAAANLEKRSQFGSQVDPMEKRIVDVYTELRQESSSFSGINITVRHLESIIRMSEAHAKMHLRGKVTAEDIDFGVRMMVETFITTQKFSVQRGLRKKLAKYLNKGRNLDGLLMDAIREMLREEVADYRLRGQAVPSRVSIGVDAVSRKARQLGVDTERFLIGREFRDSGLRFERESNEIVNTDIAEALI